MSYAFLILPAANRVYRRSAPALAQAELAVIAAEALADRLEHIQERHIAGLSFVSFDLRDGGQLDPTDLAVLSNLSSMFALFEVNTPGDDDTWLRPIPLASLDRWDDDLLTIQRYPGKTNEQFTKMLLNVTLAAGCGASAFTGDKQRILDPLCGRGTTLNQAVMYGFDAYGIDVDPHQVDAYRTFFTTWLKDKRAKHRVQQGRVRRAGKVVGSRSSVTFAAHADDRRADRTQEVVTVVDDTTKALDHFSASSFDAMVADLPYGVQHGSRTAEERRRRPDELLEQSLPVWQSLLRPGAALGLSWNTRVASRAAISRALMDAGFELVTDQNFTGFAHRVDQAIERDLMVARRPPKSPR